MERWWLRESSHGVCVCTFYNDSSDQIWYTFRFYFFLLLLLLLLHFEWNFKLIIPMCAQWLWQPTGNNVQEDGGRNCMDWGGRALRSFFIQTQCSMHNTVRFRRHSDAAPNQSNRNIQRRRSSERERRRRKSKHQTWHMELNRSSPTKSKIPNQTHRMIRQCTRRTWHSILIFFLFFVLSLSPSLVLRFHIFRRVSFRCPDDWVLRREWVQCAHLTTQSITRLVVIKSTCAQFHSFVSLRSAQRSMLTSVWLLRKASSLSLSPIH